MSSFLTLLVLSHPTTSTVPPGHIFYGRYVTRERKESESVCVPG